MTDLATRPFPTVDRPSTQARTPGDIAMLTQHEALARSRHRSDLERARHLELARRMAAGRRWSALAGWAQGRADAARAAVELDQPGPAPVRSARDAAADAH